MSRRSLTLIIASIGVIAALAIAVLIPVPYVILGPGPTLNTLGKDSSGQPLITVVGHPTYPTTGNLNMVTVGYQGGPGVTINIFSALAAWLNPHEAVVPESELFAPGATQQETQQQDTQQMTGSQQSATAAALTELHIPYSTQVVVVQTEKGYPAYGVLKSGDVITAVDGAPVTGESDLTSLIGAHPAGSTLTLTIVRDGRTQMIRVGTKEAGGRPVMGVQVTEQYKFPFTVKISVGDIGGPSGRSHRRHPAEDGGRPQRRRDGLPGSRRELLRRQGRDPGRPAGSQGRYPQPGRQRPGRPKVRSARPLLLTSHHDREHFWALFVPNCSRS